MTRMAAIIILVGVATSLYLLCKGNIPGATYAMTCAIAVKIFDGK